MYKFEIEMIDKSCMICEKTFKVSKKSQEMCCSKECQEKLEIQQLKKSRLANIGKYLRSIGVEKRFHHATIENFEGDTTSITNWIKHDRESNIMIYSEGVGNGKTHLGTAILRELGIEYSLKVRAINFPVLLMKLKASFSSEPSGQAQMTEKMLLDYCCTYDVLLVDDVEAEKVSEYSESILYLIINTRYEAMKPTIITTNLTPEGVESRYHERIISRMADGLVYHVTGDDERWKRKTIGKQ